MKYDLRELFPFGIISDAPSVSYQAALIHRIAAETLDMNNPTAWRDILPRLRAAGVPHREALTVRREGTPSCFLGRATREVEVDGLRRLCPLRSSDRFDRCS